MRAQYRAEFKEHQARKREAEMVARASKTIDAVTDNFDSVSNNLYNNDGGASD